MSGVGHYILDDDHHVVKVDFMTWALWFENYESRTVAKTTTQFHRVSTVFMGLDHRYWGGGPPLVFETMSFPIGNTGEIYWQEECSTYRYAFWDDAVAGHETEVRRLQKLEAEGLAQSGFAAQHGDDA